MHYVDAQKSHHIQLQQLLEKADLVESDSILKARKLIKDAQSHKEQKWQNQTIFQILLHPHLACLL